MGKTIERLISRIHINQERQLALDRDLIIHQWIMTSGQYAYPHESLIQALKWIESYVEHNAGEWPHHIWPPLREGYHAVENTGLQTETKKGGDKTQD